MKKNVDFLVVGCGLSGSVIARYLAEEHHKRVMIWERRNHIAGNMFDYTDEHGILVHQYGPHTFHTTKKPLFDYLTRFGRWFPYKLTAGALINGKFTPTPFNFKTIDDYFSTEIANSLKQRLMAAFPGRETVTIVELLKHSDELIKMYADFLFENDYKPYTAKQWGIPPSQIDISVLKRVPVRLSYRDGYFEDSFQVMPEEGYAKFFRLLLDHPDISLKLGVDALKRLSVSESGEEILLDGSSTDIKIIYTGALDELFGSSEGALPYRSLHFDWKFEEIDSFQEAPVVAYPQEKDFTRITEYKKLPIQNVRGTSYAVEYPLVYHPDQKNEPYYPVLTEASQRQYQVYEKKAQKIKDFYYCGRLADFKYYNMDQALERALDICKQLSSSIL